jgi:hypothetical protein
MIGFQAGERKRSFLQKRPDRLCGLRNFVFLGAVGPYPRGEAAGA